jgi:hypothetical protein
MILIYMTGGVFTKLFYKLLTSFTKTTVQVPYHKDTSQCLGTVFVVKVGPISKFILKVIVKSSANTNYREAINKKQIFINRVGGL